ncbi:hypothetical protein [Streptomyces daliensis]|uniref:Uncharacterized protein n=1 Tax=Streptomyces daliensis TaxID=299421 RepID=A0A8T4IWW3_9ACTN|nr:hypothetical protein [Streptomyces daliensis]
MAHTRSRKRGPHRALRREAPSTVAVLAEESDFALMRGYRSFTFADHRTYLRQMEGLLRSLSGEGIHTRVAVFDAVDYRLFCHEERLDPDTPASRTRYVAEVAASGATVAYTGQPMARLVQALTDTQACRAAWEKAAEVLSRAGACAACGADIARVSLDRAARAVSLLMEAAGEGTHHLVCSVGVPGSPLVTALDAYADEDGALRVDETAALALTTSLAAGLATDSPGGLVLRTEREGARDTVRGWNLHGDWLRALTAAEVFTAYCTDPVTGDPVPPEHGVDHLPGLELPHPGGDLHC